MRYLIVNADDLGQTSGINRGIAEAHGRGVVTSASLLVDEPASAEAAGLSAELPELSIGLHVKITDEYARPLIDLRDATALSAELCRQVELFQALLGRGPTHLDSHHNVHLQPAAAPHFGELAQKHGLALRGCSPIRYFPRFFGQWDGETHLEQISIESLLAMFERDVGHGFTELSCHPGYVDATLTSTYSIEREAELHTLCDPLIRSRLDELGVELVSSAAAGGLLAAASLRS
ncbi:MAG: ChbG/HpnK family deacetylase [Actinomycetota bacterium]